MLESVFSQPLLCFHCKSYEFSLHLIVNLCIGNVCISKLQRITLNFKKEIVTWESLASKVCHFVGVL